MNVDRRITIRVCIELLKECHTIGTIHQASHDMLVEAVLNMRNAEYWSLRNQEKHEGANDSTDKGIAISRVALPALEKAGEALKTDDYDTVIEQLTLAATTDGTVPRKSRRKK